MIRADDFAKLSRNLVGSLPTETRIRCAIGRAYYAVFHYCQKCADQYCGELTAQEKQDQGKHSRLYLRLEGHSKYPALDAHLRTLAVEAKKLRDLRVRSDYHLETDTLTDRELKDGHRLLAAVENEYKSIQSTPLPSAPTLKNTASKT